MVVMEKPRMDTDKHGLVFEEKTYQIIGCAMSVLNELGHGFFEKVYENALAIELAGRNIPFQKQQKFNVSYKNQIVGEYIPDFVIFNEIILEIKTIDRITNIEKGQVLNYLKVTGLSVGLILNFKNPKLEWERVIL